MFKVDAGNISKANDSGKEKLPRETAHPLLSFLPWTGNELPP
jgi:hypothetical protein